MSVFTTKLGAPGARWRAGCRLLLTLLGLGGALGSRAQQPLFTLLTAQETGIAFNTP